MEPEAPAFEPFAAPPGVHGPLGVAGTLTAAFNLYTADLLQLWGTIAAVIVPVETLGFVLKQIALPRGIVLDHGQLYVAPGTHTTPFVVFSLFTIGLTAIGSLIATGATYRIVLGRHLHHPAGVAMSLSFALERFVPLLWVSLLYVLVLALGFAALILPGIYLLIAGSLSVTVLMAEDRRGLAAIRRSLGLCRGRFWHVFGVIVAAFVMVGLGQGVASGAVTAVAAGVAPHSVSAHLVADAIAQSLSAIVFTPLVATSAVVLYVDLLLRQEDPYLEQLLA